MPPLLSSLGDWRLWSALYPTGQNWKGVWTIRPSPPENFGTWFRISLSEKAGRSEVRCVSGIAPLHVPFAILFYAFSIIHLLHGAMMMLNGAWNADGLFGEILALPSLLIGLHLFGGLHFKRQYEWEAVVATMQRTMESELAR